MKVINVVAAIIKSCDKIFITKRDHGEFKGKWMKILNLQSTLHQSG